jgi:Outer membrane protein beta-barrel domain
MNKLTILGLRMGALGAVAALCTGCPNPNTYGTPRTTPAGKIQHSIAAEAWGYRGTDAETDASIGSTLPTFPTYTLRVGVADTVDIGARFSNFSSLGADVKWNFLKGDTFDMAIDPGFQIFHFGTSGTAGDEEADTSLTVLYLNAPVMFGINVSDSVSIVPTLGVSYGWASATVESGDEDDTASGTSGIMLRPGLGFDFRISNSFALHPEITFLKTLQGDDEDSVLMYMFGLGFNFGNLPKYGSADPAE